MILVGSQRGGAGQLARHLLNDRDNDHVTVHELRGFMASDLYGALAEAHAISKGTRCQQFMFSLSLNPPKDAEASIEALIDAAQRAEQALGLDGQPRAILIHEKEGRRHAHVVWSRIDADDMKAINLSYFKNRLNALSKELYLEHEWDLPEGHRTHGWKNPLNFTLAEWQQAQRLDLDPREVKQMFREAWERSDNLSSFRHALEERGYFLAKGDRRGFVAVDIHGEVFAVARWAGVKTKDVRDRLGDPDRLPDVEQTRRAINERLTERQREFIRADRKNQAEELKPLATERRAMVVGHRLERELIKAKQEERWQRETRERSEKLHKGLRGVLQLVTGRKAAIQRQNEQEAWKGVLRDREQREELYRAQMKEREALQLRIDELRKRHRQDRMRLMERMAEVSKATEQAARDRERTFRRRRPPPDFTIEH